MSDSRRTAIWQLHQTLTGQQLETELHATEPSLTIPGDATDGHRTIEVHCDRRASDGGRLWYYVSADGAHGYRPLAEVERITDAAVAIAGERRIRL